MAFTRAGVEVGATNWTRSSPAGSASARRGPDSSYGRSGTISPSTPASTAARAKPLRPNTNTGL